MSDVLAYEQLRKGKELGVRLFVRLEQIFVYLGALLLSLMLFAPYKLLPIKAVLIVCILVAISARIFLRKNTGLSRPVMIWFCIFILYGLFFTITALLIEGNVISYIFRSATVNIVWPILYLFFVTGVQKRYVIDVLYKTMIYAALLIGLYCISATLMMLGFLPQVIPLDMVDMATDPDNDNYQKIVIPSATALIFLIPYVLTLIIFLKQLPFKINKILLYITFIVGVVAVVFTARRILILNILLTPIFVWIFLKLGKVKVDAVFRRHVKKMLLYFVGGIIIIGIVLNFFELVDFTALSNVFFAGFNFDTSSAGESPYLRALQFNGLLKSWLDYPILGQGHGTASHYIIRSQETPWIYELSYLALLFQTGLVGILIYGYLLFWIFYKGISIMKISNTYTYYVLPVLVGALSFLLANATNPYLQSYENMWAIFLPIMVINFYHIYGKQCNYKCDKK
ncbi:O-antigen ligase family protein [Chitinophaga eiseniae]|uniref:O-antigen ligase like membrane protein n=1 Tax=Chitinophaga eiseniae TaxID=634771 RepID=A0A847SR91_9BACT|nr:hypothetical protein [Chitinophaga eiseniae]NLR78612.1 hypothetical protein [Chitinophaga eiseniae]